MPFTQHRAALSFILGAGFLASLLTPARASCRYFLTAAIVVQCKEESPADLKGLNRFETEIPELPASNEGKLMHVRCRCDYELSGANPLCDSDQDQEVDSAMGTDNNVNPCVGAKTFCDHLCPQNLK